LLGKRATGERVSCDNAVIREVFVSREIKSTKREHRLGFHFQFHEKALIHPCKLMIKLSPEGLK
jgi:hypothetical protein